MRIVLNTNTRRGDGHFLLATTVACVGVRLGSIISAPTAATAYVPEQDPIRFKNLSPNPTEIDILTSPLTKTGKMIGFEVLTESEVSRKIRDSAERLARSRHTPELNEITNALLLHMDETINPEPCLPSHLGRWLYGKRCESRPPADFPPGAYLRIGPNGASTSDGYLDGDGMVVSVAIPPGACGPARHGKSDHEDDRKNDGRRSLPAFSATYVETRGRELERRRNTLSLSPLLLPSDATTYSGSLGSAPRGLPLLLGMLRNSFAFATPQAQKDTCNTALSEHGGRVLAMMEQCPPTEVEMCKDGRFRTVKNMERLGGAVRNDDWISGGAMGAHGRTCPETGVRYHVTYNSSKRPYVRVDAFAVDGNEKKIEDSQEADDAPEKKRKGWNLIHSVGVDVEVPVMMHDFLLTENYVVLLDLPLTLRPTRLLNDRFPIEYEPEHGARIGLLRRDELESAAARKNDGDCSGKNGDGGCADVRWFDVEPGVVLHAFNAHETSDGKDVVVHALRSEPRDSSSYILKYSSAFLHEWTLDLESGTSSERCLNSYTMLDFPTGDPRMTGRDMKYGLAVSLGSVGGPIRKVSTPEEGALIDGIVKIALTDDEDKGVKRGDILDKFTAPRGWYVVSEATVVPKTGGGEEGAGEYVTVLATRVPPGCGNCREGCERREGGMRSQLLILDAEHMSEGPVAAIDLPQRVGNGLHSTFLEWDKLK